MRLGQAALEALQAEIEGRILPGEDLVIAGAVGLSGTVAAAEQKEEELRRHFSAGFLEQCRRLKENYGTGDTPENQQIREICRRFGASALYDAGEGGILCGVWKMAEASQVGLTADLRKIPIRQETIEVCEIFDLNPYRLHSEGALLVGIRGGDGLVQELNRAGCMAAVIGQANKSNDRLLYSVGNARYLDRPTEDEIYKIQNK